jgi:alkane 1-monooxygenase
MYLHFFYEHNFGHHKNVSTPEDSNSSRLNENLYAFLVRSIVGGYRSAWNIQLEQLSIAKKSFFSLKNEMLLFQITQLGALILIYFIFGNTALICYFFSGMIGIIVLETVNYIQHYGLSRNKKANGAYEKTTIAHSWNADFPLGRAVLFELSRHSDHHYRTNKKYQTLNSYEESPQMPTGYPGMMILAMIPPLWFRIMNKRVLDYKMKHSHTHDI